MTNSGIFSYINVIGKAADASWLRNDIIGGNIANANTPGYKRKDVSFEDELQKALMHSGQQSMGEKVRELDLNSKRLEGKVYTDLERYSYRLDKNNVDIQTENVELAANQIKYHGLVTAVNGSFNALKTVIK